jgi:hypothetical protein
MTRPIDPAVREQEILAARRASSDVAARAPTGPVPDANGVTVDLDLASTISRAPALDVASTVAAGCVLRERYVIEEKLGTGGKGTVFKALDRYRSSLPEFRHYVALKILHAGRDCSEETIKSLRRELECGQLLSHRNIVNVFELDRDGDVVFFTMELLDGELLSDVLGRMRPAALQPGQAWQIVRQLGAGLEHAHERGIVHGDLKPRNIMITREGEVRILDFGTARNGARTPPGSPQPGSAPVSATPAYASCEMLEGRAIDPRDDLYALACISYELLSGAHPFAHRPATLARDFGIKASRPAGLTGGQWRTLLAGLSWHRAGRSMSVHTFVRRLTQGIPAKAAMTPLRDLRRAGTAAPLWQTRIGPALVALGLVAAVCLAQLREGPARKAGDASNTQRTQRPGGAETNAAAPSAAGEPTAPGALVAEARAASTPMASAKPADPASPPPPEQRKPAMQPAPARISVDGYRVSSGDHFVEIRVHRNQLQKGASFAWWTEPATAKQDVDYVHQPKAIQTFACRNRAAPSAIISTW